MKVVAKHLTKSGFSVAILRDDAGNFQICKGDRQDNYLTFDYDTTLEGARASANRVWLEDMGITR